MRARIVEAALGWRGTPYAHGQSVKGVTTDCLGLVRGVWREVCGEEPWAVPPYSPDWAETGVGEPLLEGLRAAFEPVQLGEAQAGDVVVFRLSPEASAKHMGILVSGAVGDRGAKFVHAYWGRAAVVSWLWPFWGTKVVGAFRFPGGGEVRGPLHHPLWADGPPPRVAGR